MRTADRAAFDVELMNKIGKSRWRGTPFLRIQSLHEIVIEEPSTTEGFSLSTLFDKVIQN
jgi:hypothetical protein